MMKPWVIRDAAILANFESWLQSSWKAALEAGKPIALKPCQESRSISQNAAQWPILEAWSEQVEWPVNGNMQKLSPEDWKDILTAAFLRETVRVAQGLDGGLVMLGARTHLFNRKQFSDWLEFLNAASAERGVKVERVAV